VAILRGVVWARIEIEGNISESDIVAVEVSLSSYHVRHNILDTCKGRRWNLTSLTRLNLLPQNFGRGHNTVVIKVTSAVKIAQIVYL
jgi:hypothetical protein